MNNQIKGEAMTQNQLLITIIIISSCFFIGSLLLNHGKWVLDAVSRGGLGLVVIALVNEILTGFGLTIPVGINLLNFSVSAILGIPGIVALYGISLWQIFY